MAQSSLRVEPPENPGRFTRKTSVFSAGAGYIGDNWQVSLSATDRNAGSSLHQPDWDGVLDKRGEQFDGGIDGQYRDAHIAAARAGRPSLSSLWQAPLCLVTCSVATCTFSFREQL